MNIHKNMLAGLVAVALGAAAVAPAQAADGWFVRAGVTYVSPDSNTGSLAGGALQTDIDNQAGLGLVIGKYLTDNLAFEVLGALPFEHTVSLNGADAVDFKHLPPVFSLVYYFNNDGTVSPFLGAGVNYTWTFDEKARSNGPIAGAKVRVGNSWGLAAQAGLKFRVNDSWDVVTDLRWVDIDADVKVNGANVGSVSVDPLVGGLHVGYRF